MRTFGIISISLGVVVLMFSVFPVLGAETPMQFWAGLACAGLIGQEKRVRTIYSAGK